MEGVFSFVLILKYLRLYCVPEMELSDVSNLCIYPSPSQFMNGYKNIILTETGSL